MDIGRTLTHKKLAFHNFKKKMSTSENARSIDHSPISVDKYIRDGIRVEKLHGAGNNEYDISFLTGLSIGLVNEYIKVITEILSFGRSDYYSDCFSRYDGDPYGVPEYIQRVYQPGQKNN